MYMYYIWIYRCFGYINFSCFIWYSKFICICHRQNLTIIVEILTVGFVGLSFSIIMVSKWNYYVRGMRLELKPPNVYTWDHLGMFVRADSRNKSREVPPLMAAAAGVWASMHRSGSAVSQLVWTRAVRNL